MRLVSSRAPGDDTEGALLRTALPSDRLPSSATTMDDGSAPDVADLLTERQRLIDQPGGRVIDFLGARAKLDALCREGIRLAGERWPQLCHAADKEGGG